MTRSFLSMDRLTRRISDHAAGFLFAGLGTALVGFVIMYVFATRSPKLVLSGMVVAIAGLVVARVAVARKRRLTP